MNECCRLWFWHTSGFYQKIEIDFSAFFSFCIKECCQFSHSSSSSQWWTRKLLPFRSDIGLCRIDRQRPLHHQSSSSRGAPIASKLMQPIRIEQIPKRSQMYVRVVSCFFLLLLHLLSKKLESINDFLFSDRHIRVVTAYCVLPSFYWRNRYTGRCRIANPVLPGRKVLHREDQLVSFSPAWEMSKMLDLPVLSKIENEQFLKHLLITNCRADDPLLE